VFSHVFNCDDEATLTHDSGSYSGNGELEVGLFAVYEVAARFCTPVVFFELGEINTKE